MDEQSNFWRPSSGIIPAILPPQKTSFLIIPRGTKAATLQIPTRLEEALASW